MTAPTPTATHATNSNNRGRALLWLTLILLLLGLAWFLTYFFYFRGHQWTDDAYVNGDKISVTPVIAGTPIAFYADDTDLVEEGQILVLLDSTEYQILYKKELASLASSVLQVRQLYDQVTATAAVVSNKQTAAAKARYDFDNRQKLIGSKAISQEDYIHSRDAYTLAELDLKQAQAQHEVALAAAGNTPIERHPILEAQKAAVRDAYYKLVHCAVLAPATGYIAQRGVQVGQWVSPSVPLMAIIPLERMWVDANYKETELGEVRIGQPATVTFDLYGSKVSFNGSVIGIASGTGSVFSLIPPQNATGNWIKIVQRLPVRIGLDPDQLKNHPLRLGLSAEVKIDITRTDLPMMPTTPATKAVVTTKAFGIDTKNVEKAIEKVIQDNLKPPSGS